MSIFKGYDRHTPYLLPPSVDDWLPHGHLCYFVADVVERLDLSEIKTSYSRSGSPAYSPELLVGLLFYGYATGVFSSRKIEAATYESLAFRHVAANQHPDHDTISDFRRKFLPQLEGIFLQILVLAVEMGIKKIGKVSLDGTKIKANAHKNKALSWAHANKIEAQLKEEIASLLKKAEAADDENMTDGMSIPEEISRREKRLQAIDSAKEKIKARAAERYEREKVEYDEKITKRAEKAAATGRKPGGKVPKMPINEPLAKDQVNLTDEESRIMKTSSKGFEQCYNAQACVDIDTMLIVVCHVTNCSNDKKEVKPALGELAKLPANAAEITDIAADTGYHSKANVQMIIDNKINPLIAEKREKHHQSPQMRFAENPILPEGATDAEKASHRLQTKEGKALYAKRKCTVEPVFGNIKHGMGFRQFLLRGLKNVTGEWTLVSIAWNLKRLHKLIQNMAENMLIAQLAYILHITKFMQNVLVTYCCKFAEKIGICYKDYKFALRGFSTGS